MKHLSPLDLSILRDAAQATNVDDLHQRLSRAGNAPALPRGYALRDMMASLTLALGWHEVGYEAIDWFMHGLRLEADTPSHASAHLLLHPTVLYWSRLFAWEVALVRAACPGVVPFSSPGVALALDDAATVARQRAGVIYALECADNSDPVD